MTKRGRGRPPKFTAERVAKIEAECARRGISYRKYAKMTHLPYISIIVARLRVRKAGK